MPKTYHAISDADKATMAATREFLKSMPAMVITPEVRPFFDDMITQIPLADGIDYEEGTLGGVSGWWCRPQNAPSHAAILYLHGGGYVVGSANAYRHPVGQIAADTGVSAFALDYSLAPESPFPAAVDDAVAVYDALVSQDYTHIAIAGDSAGGGLALSLLAIACTERDVKPVAAVAISPWVDLTVSGETMASRVAVDPLLDSTKLTDSANLYLNGADPRDPRASPLFGRFDSLAPVLIHVGDDEVLLDDAVRYADLAERAGSSIELHVWEGMIHVFTSSIATLEAAKEAARGIAAFLAKQLLAA